MWVEFKVRLDYKEIRFNEHLGSRHAGDNERGGAMMFELKCRQHNQLHRDGPDAAYHRQEAGPGLVRGNFTRHMRRYKAVPHSCRHTSTTT